MSYGFTIRSSKIERRLSAKPIAMGETAFVPSLPAQKKPAAGQTFRASEGSVVFAVLVRGLAVKFLKGAVEVACVLIAHGADDLFDRKAAGAKEFFRSF